jgi:hypothetical protein
MLSVRHLFELVLEVKIEARVHEVYMHTWHISGDRMIATGIDGRSMGNYDAGISLGFDLRPFVPLYLSVSDLVGGRLEDWCKIWMGEDFTPLLDPAGWFEEGHRPGVHIWALPPAVGLIVLKKMERSCLKRRCTTAHVVLIPRLLYQEEWHSHFEKAVNLWFPLSCGNVLPASNCKPLMIGIHFSFSRSYPWEVKQECKRMVEHGRALLQMSKSCHFQVGNYLRQLWSNPRKFQAMSGGMVR